MPAAEIGPISGAWRCSAAATVRLGRNGGLQLVPPALALISLVLAQPVLAQSADVPRPDARGDFHSSLVNGPRGAYGQRFWLVVDRDPYGLLCRDARGRAWLALKYGSVLEAEAAAAPPPAPLLERGPTWLRVQVKPVDVLLDARPRAGGLDPFCWVRAHTTVLAPLNPDSLRQVSGWHP